VRFLWAPSNEGAGVSTDEGTFPSALLEEVGRVSETQINGTRETLERKGGKNFSFKKVNLLPESGEKVWKESSSQEKNG